MALNYAWTPQVSMPGANYQMNPYGMQGPVSSIVWVNGELGARNYPIAPNTSILLMDSDSPKFYIKSADLLGVQAVRSYEYNELTNQNTTQESEKTMEATKKVETKPQNDPSVEYVSRKEFDELKKTIDDLMS